MSDPTCYDEAYSYSEAELRRLVALIERAGGRPQCIRVRASFYDAHHRAAQASYLADALGWYR